MRVRGRRTFLAASLCFLVGLGPAPVQAPSVSLSQAVGRLARERSFAESGAGLLKRYATSDRAAMLKGEQLYGSAKASFDELVVQLQTDLDQGAVPEGSPELRRALEAAVQQRLAFSRHVDAAVKLDPGARPAILDALAGGVGDIVTGVLEAATAIWKEYRAGDQLRRQSITTRLEAQRWKAFGEVPG